MFDQITDFLKNGITTTVGLVVSIFGSADSQVANISQVMDDPTPIVEELATLDETNFDNIQTPTIGTTEQTQPVETVYFERKNVKDPVFSRGTGVIATTESTSEEVRSVNPLKTTTSDKNDVDSSLLLGTDLDKFDIGLKITEVKENDESYFVTYQYKTFFIEDNIWKISIKEDNISIRKEMVAGKDLEKYISGELQEIAENELLYLKEIKVILRKKVLAKQTKTSNTFGNLIGKKIEAVEPIDYNQVVIVENSKKNPPVTNPVVVPEVVEDNTTDSGVIDNEAPLIVIQGNNPALIQIGASYADLGAKVTDNISNNLGVVTGGDVVDTEIEGSYFVTYTATDEAGNVATATREVIVYDYGTTPVVVETPEPVVEEVVEEEEVVPVVEEVVEEEIVEEVIEVIEPEVVEEVASTTEETSLVGTIPVSPLPEEIPVVEEVVEETPEPIIEEIPEVVEEEIVEVTETEVVEETSLIETIPESPVIEETPVIEEVVEETPVVVSLLNFLGNARSSLQANIYNTQEKTSGSIKSIITPVSSFVNKSIKSLFSWF